MSEVYAIDLMNMMPPMNAARMADDPHATVQGLFALTCAIELFAEMVDERFEGMAHALCVTSRKLYDTFSVNTLSSSTNRVMGPEEVGAVFQRFENVYVCMDELADELLDQWQAMVAWRNIQDRYIPLRSALIHNIQFYQFDI